jgi:hypothetical protein
MLPYTETLLVLVSALVLNARAIYVDDDPKDDWGVYSDCGGDDMRSDFLSMHYPGNPYCTECKVHAWCAGGGSSECRAGHAGDGCSMCKEGWWMGTSVCNECPEFTGWVSFLFYILVTVLFAKLLNRVASLTTEAEDVGGNISSAKAAVASLPIVLTHFQVKTVFLNFRFGLGMKELLGWMTFPAYFEFG